MAQDEGRISKILGRHAKKIGETDATNKEELRVWLDAVDHAQQATNAPDNLIFEMVNYLVREDFATWIIDFTNSLPAEHRTWQNLREGIVTSYLDPEELNFLKRKVGQMTQKAAEDVRRYGVRFGSAVKRAYTQNELAVPYIISSLIETFVAGLSDEEVRLQVFCAEPDSLQEAFTLAGTKALAIEKTRLQSRKKEPVHNARKEEDMEVGALTHSRKDPKIEALERKFNDLVQLNKTLQGEVKSMRRPQSQPQPQQLPPQQQVQQQQQLPPQQLPQQWAPQPYWAPQEQQQPYGQYARGRGRGRGRGSWRAGNPVCWTCGKTGHIQRDCRTRSMIHEAVQAAMSENQEQEN